MALLSSGTQADDNVTVNINGELDPSPCWVSFSTESLQFATMDYIDIKGGDEISATGNDITVTYRCFVDSSIHAQFQDTVAYDMAQVPSNAGFNEANTSAGAFTVRTDIETGSRPIGQLFLVSQSTQLPIVTGDGNNVSVDRLKNFNLTSQHAHANSRMGPLDIQAGTPLVWTLRPELRINRNAFDGTQDINFNASVDVTLQF